MAALAEEAQAELDRELDEHKARQAEHRAFVERCADERLSAQEAASAEVPPACDKACRRPNRKRCLKCRAQAGAEGNGPKSLRDFARGCSSDWLKKHGPLRAFERPIKEMREQELAEAIAAHPDWKAGAAVMHAVAQKIPRSLAICRSRRDWHQARDQLADSAKEACRCLALAQTSIKTYAKWEEIVAQAKKAGVQVPSCAAAETAGFQVTIPKEEIE